MTKFHLSEQNFIVRNNILFGEMKTCWPELRYLVPIILEEQAAHLSSEDNLS